MIWSEETHPGWTPAQAEAAGKTHLQIFCAHCRLLVQMPWGLMRKLPRDRPMRDTVPKLKCSRCGARPDPTSVVAWEQSDAPGYAPFSTR